MALGGEKYDWPGYTASTTNAVVVPRATVVTTAEVASAATVATTPELSPRNTRYWSGRRPPGCQLTRMVPSVRACAVTPTGAAAGPTTAGGEELAGGEVSAGGL